MAYFRAVTMGKPVVMGRKTYLSIGKPLKGRTNIVVTATAPSWRRACWAAPKPRGGAGGGARDALRRAPMPSPFVGGAEIYAQTMAQADRLVITRCIYAPTGDTNFPTIEPGGLERGGRSEHQPGPMTRRFQQARLPTASLRSGINVRNRATGGDTRGDLMRCALSARLELAL